MLKNQKGMKNLSPYSYQGPKYIGYSVTLWKEQMVKYADSPYPSPKCVLIT